MPVREELIAHSHRARTKAKRPLQPLRRLVVPDATKIGIAALRSQTWRHNFADQPLLRRSFLLDRELDALRSTHRDRRVRHPRARRTAADEAPWLKCSRAGTLFSPSSGKIDARSVVSLIPRSRANTASVARSGDTPRLTPPAHRASAGVPSSAPPRSPYGLGFFHPFALPIFEPPLVTSKCNAF